jgi:protein transport protein SEC61 subunit gamma-like protein|tara:strand:+ start:424 stop:603 length:180 start_codon:yes stop_codon:yes gene_type:complete
MNETLNNLKSFFFKSKRVWYVLKKPTKEEFVTIAKISAIGILVVGVVGFMISIAMGYIV